MSPSVSDAVFYFGGYGSTQSDIDKWLNTARTQKPHVDFTGFPYPKDAGSSDTAAVTAFKKQGTHAAALHAIQGSSAPTIYIVGHSSGCAIANDVDAHLSPSSTTSVVLVALDGFRPSKEQLRRATTQVWGAECEGKNSRNHPAEKDPKDKSLAYQRRIYPATGCKTMWALHFSLVNTNASDSLIPEVKNGWSNGYNKCQANLLFL